MGEGGRVVLGGRVRSKSRRQVVVALGLAADAALPPVKSPPGAGRSTHERSAYLCSSPSPTSSVRVSEICTWCPGCAGSRARARMAGA